MLKDRLKDEFFLNIGAIESDTGPGDSGPEGDPFTCNVESIIWRNRVRRHLPLYIKRLYKTSVNRQNITIKQANYGRGDLHHRININRPYEWMHNLRKLKPRRETPNVKSYRH